MFVESYLQTAEYIIEHYELQQPLNLFLKTYFKKNKKFGSRDRKFISELIFGFYRIGKQKKATSLRLLILNAAFVKSELPLLFFEKTLPHLAPNYSLPPEQKLKLLTSQNVLKFDFPYSLSNGLTHEDFQNNFFSEQRVFIRTRNNKNEIINILNSKHIEFLNEQNDAISFNANCKLDEILSSEMFVVQDLASQQVGTYFKPKPRQIWWDCCAASGGKSIMLLDFQPNIKLIVSDVRESILKNLHHRFLRYNYQSKYTSYCLDLLNPVYNIENNSIDNIICDVPCSGSGTWARCPEQFYFFSEEKLTQFQYKQLTIAQHALEKLKPGGSLYYITCSVFKQENEAIVTQLLNENCKLITQQLITFPRRGADILFIAQLSKLA